MNNQKQIDPLLQFEDRSTIDKYKTAGGLTVNIIDHLIELLDVNIDINKVIVDTTIFGQKLIDGVYKNIKSKGYCQPICVSINNIAGNNIPKQGTLLKDGDLVKIECGVHIDGYPTTLCHSFIVGNVIDPNKEKLINVCMEASNRVIKMMTPNNTTLDVKKVINQIATSNGFNLPITDIKGIIPGEMSYQVSRYIMCQHVDDPVPYIHQIIIPRHNSNYDFEMQSQEFMENEVYMIDIVMTDSNGRLDEFGDSCTIYQRTEFNTNLKSPMARKVCSSFTDNFPKVLTLDNKTRFGLSECIKSNVVNRWPVTQTKEGTNVARIKFTILVRNEPIILCAKFD